MHTQKTDRNPKSPLDAGAAASHTRALSPAQAMSSLTPEDAASRPTAASHPTATSHPTAASRPQPRGPLTAQRAATGPELVTAVEELCLLSGDRDLGLPGHRETQMMKLG